jgi:DNA-binding transcriptional LysR family regulator
MDIGLRARVATINRMSELIPIELQLSAVVLAQELSVCSAAEKLGISPAILRSRMSELATRLECSLFQEEGDRVEITKDGEVLINAFRSFLTQK